MGRPGPVVGGERSVNTGDWRSQLLPSSRQRIINKIVDTLKRHLPFVGEEGLQELKKMAVRFEEKFYASATSQPDYLRQISLKMLTMEKSQSTVTNSPPSNSRNNSNNPIHAVNLMGRPGPVIGGGEPSVNTGDWRSQLLSASRQRIINKIMDTLKKHRPFYGEEGLQDLKNEAEGIEERAYISATSQPDYLRQISLKMLRMETQNNVTNSPPSNSENNSENSTNAGEIIRMGN